MTSFAQEWQSDYERARSMLQPLLSGASSTPDRQMGRVAALVDGLDERLSKMEQRPVDYAIGQGELARRRASLDSLRQQMTAAGGSRGSGAGGGVWHDQTAAGGSHGSGAGGGVPSRLEQQQEAMREQDRMLEELGRGVGRLKSQSTMINEEASLHVRLLDEMEDDAEQASSGLRAEARHAEKIRIRGRTFNLYVIIALLTIILLVLIFAGI